MTGGLEPGMHGWKTIALPNTPSIGGPYRKPRIMNKQIGMKDTIIALKSQSTSTID